MRRAAAMLAVLLTTTAAQAQESIHPKTRVMTAEEMANLVNPVNPADPEAGLPLYKRTACICVGSDLREHTGATTR